MSEEGREIVINDFLLTKKRFLFYELKFLKIACLLGLKNKKIYENYFLPSREFIFRIDSALPASIYLHVKIHIYAVLNLLIIIGMPAVRCS